LTYFTGHIHEYGGKGDKNTLFDKSVEEKQGKKPTYMTNLG
jgi:hypothetical protein